ncbi:MAG TPA: phosphohistidine phosphatase SixA [Terriglobales bacterium]|nr:phosphohistidine phosphatase SixA [Terriglobales bacterium]
MNIYFLRHASAGSHKASPAADEKRPLDAEGIEQCGMVGRALAAMDVEVEAVISSPLKRASQTATLVAREIGHEKEIEFSDALRPEADYRAFQQLLQNHANKDDIMVVGHNPNLSEFLSLLITDGAARSAVELRKGAVAKVPLDGNSWMLQWCFTPKALRSVQDGGGAKSRPKTSRK